MQMTVTDDTTIVVDSLLSSYFIFGLWLFSFEFKALDLVKIEALDVWTFEMQNNVVVG